MLILSRKIDQEIIIDEEIRIKIVQVAGGRVRVGIDCPRDVQILRGELAQLSAPLLANDVIESDSRCENQAVA